MALAFRPAAKLKWRPRDTARFVVALLTDINVHREARKVRDALSTLLKEGLFEGEEFDVPSPAKILKDIKKRLADKDGAVVLTTRYKQTTYRHKHRDRFTLTGDDVFGLLLTYMAQHFAGTLSQLAYPNQGHSISPYVVCNVVLFVGS